jgi:hypothetical protein
MRAYRAVASREIHRPRTCASSATRSMRHASKRSRRKSRDPQVETRLPGDYAGMLRGPGARNHPGKRGLWLQNRVTVEMNFWAGPDGAYRNTKPMTIVSRGRRTPGFIRVNSCHPDHTHLGTKPLGSRASAFRCSRTHQWTYRIENLSKTYPSEVPALDNVSLTIPRYVGPIGT